MPEEERKCNLGCGEFKKEGYLNVDCEPRFSPEVVHDLNKIPYPFQDDYFDVVEAEHVVEHLEDPFQVMKELHRILKPEGMLIVKVPHFSRGFTHSDHKRGFDVTLPYYFNPSFNPGYVGVEYELKKMILVWFAQPYLKKAVLSRSLYCLGLSLGKVIDTLANISPYFCSRCWCFLVGGFEEIEFHFICKK